MATDVKRLARHVRERREQLGLSQEEVANRGGPSDTTLGKIENGLGSFARQTLEKLDVGLDWRVGSARRVLEGGDPQLADPADVAQDAETMARGRAARKRLVHAARQLTFDELWEEWSDLYFASFMLEVDYSRRRQISVAAAREELWETLMSAQRGQDTRPWASPAEDERAAEDGSVVAIEAKSSRSQYAEPPQFDFIGLAARRGQSEGKRLREEQDRDAEFTD